MFNVFGRLVGGGRSIIDRMSYRNHYMCSGEATSTKYTKLEVIFIKKEEKRKVEKRLEKRDTYQVKFPDYSGLFSFVGEKGKENAINLNDVF